MIVSVIGHTPARHYYEASNTVQEELYKTLSRLCPDSINIAAGDGISLWIAQVALNLNIPYSFVYTHPNQKNIIPPFSRSTVEKIERLSDKIIHLNHPIRGKEAFEARANYLVKDADFIIFINGDKLDNPVIVPYDAMDHAPLYAAKVATELNKPRIKIDPYKDVEEDYMYPYGPYMGYMD